MEPFVANQRTIERIRQHHVDDALLYVWWVSSKEIGINHHAQASEWFRLFWEHMSDAKRKEICPSALFLERVVKGWYCNQKHPSSKQVHRQWCTLVKNGLHQLVFPPSMECSKQQGIVQSIAPFFNGDDAKELREQLQLSIHDVSA